MESKFEKICNYELQKNWKFGFDLFIFHAVIELDVLENTLRIFYFRNVIIVIKFKKIDKL
jgi:hypothetical protein